MRIGIDARFYGSRAKGLGRYTEKLISCLQDIDTVNDYIIFLDADNYQSFYPRNPKFQKRIADCKWYTLKEQYIMPSLIRRERIDLMHFPHFNVPLLYRGKFIVTIHDLIITHFPTLRATTLNPILYAIKQLGYQFVIRHATRTASKILTVSRFSQAEIVSYFKIPSEKIAVTYESVEMPIVSSENSNHIIRSTFQLSKPYILYVGTAYPHKNLEILIHAWKNICKQQKEHILVLVGKHDYFYNRLQKRVKNFCLESSIRFLGEVSEEQLHALYQEAQLYVFPSLCEGFGLPGLEAMAYGLPVAASRIPCLQEVLGLAACYFDPRDASDITNVVLGALTSGVLRQELREKGYKQIAKYSWKKMAEETLQIYQSVL